MPPPNAGTKKTQESPVQTGFRSDFSKPVARSVGDGRKRMKGRATTFSSTTRSQGGATAAFPPIGPASNSTGATPAPAASQDTAVQAWTSDILVLQSKLDNLAGSARGNASASQTSMQREVDALLERSSSAKSILDRHGYENVEKALVITASQLDLCLLAHRYDR